MIEGHGDDLHRFRDASIRYNFSSNVPNCIDHTALYKHLAEYLPHITSYPEPSAYSLESKLAEYLGIAPEEIIVTNGATEAIYLIAHLFEGKQSDILSPSFQEYGDAATLFRHQTSFISQWGQFTKEAEIIWCGTPNNPTGRVIPKEEISQEIRRTTNRIFVFDQSYADFTEKAILSNREAIESGNVILIHSMTKRFAIPGLRLGYVTAPQRIITALRGLSHPWAVNTLAIEAGCWILEHLDLYPSPTKRLLTECRSLISKLETYDWISIPPTDTHFFIMHFRGKYGTITSQELKNWLAQKRGILVRDATNMGDLGSSCIRIASQGITANKALVEALDAWYSQS